MTNRIQKYLQGTFLAVSVYPMGAIGAEYRSLNFVTTASSAAAAKLVGQTAERLRQELAEDWLGEPLRDWSDPCPITVVVQRLACGVTSYKLVEGRVFDWKVTVRGSLDSILDSTLPHEVMHTVLASHFGRLLPRWADEGICTSVEHRKDRERMELLPKVVDGEG